MNHKSATPATGTVCLTFDGRTWCAQCGQHAEHHGVVARPETSATLERAADAWLAMAPGASDPNPVGIEPLALRVRPYGLGSIGNDYRGRVTRALSDRLWLDVPATCIEAFNAHSFALLALRSTIGYGPTAHAHLASTWQATVTLLAMVLTPRGVALLAPPADTRTLAQRREANAAKVAAGPKVRRASLADLTAFQDARRANGGQAPVVLVAGDCWLAPTRSVSRDGAAREAQRELLARDAFATACLAQSPHRLGSQLV